jgi:hypothetical protein
MPLPGLNGTPGGNKAAKAVKRWIRRVLVLVPILTMAQAPKHTADTHLTHGGLTPDSD